MMRYLALIVLTGLFCTLPVGAQERVYSGPQVGEKTTPFKVQDVTGPGAGQEVDYVTAFRGEPSVLVFVHGLERSMVPLMRVVDQYGAERNEKLHTLFVVLADDRLAMTQRLPLVKQSLRMQSPLTLSIDGPEGPGNYGLNKTCLLTILVARENRVTANFALVQPGIVDAPRVIAEIARVINDPKPPTPDELQAHRQALYEEKQNGNRSPSQGATGRQAPDPDLMKLDLNTQEGLRDAIRQLVAQVQLLRREVAELRERLRK